MYDGILLITYYENWSDKKTSKTVQQFAHKYFSVI